MLNKIQTKYQCNSRLSNS